MGNETAWNTYHISNLATINCNSYGYYPQFFITNREKTQPDIILNVSGKNQVFTGYKQFGPDLFFSEKDDCVISEIKLLGLKGVLSIKRLAANPTEVTINKKYVSLSKTLLKIPLSSAFPDKAFAQMILHIKLLIKKHTFLVGSCFQPRNAQSSILLSSIGGMGKTSLIFKAVKEFGGKYLSDDMVIINKDGVVYSYPKLVRVRKTRYSTLNIESYRKPEDIFGEREMIATSSNIGSVVLLERGAENSLKLIDSEGASRKLLLITRKLLPYYMERTILCYSYMNPDLDIQQLLSEEAKIMSEFTKNSKCYVLTSKTGNPESAINLLRELI